MSENNIVRDANGILASLVFSLKPVYTGNSFTDAATDVVCKRLRKKFDFAQLSAEGSKEQRDVLRHAAWTSFAEGNRRMAEINARLRTPEARKDIRILKMKSLIRSWCKGYNPQDHGFWPGPGMSFGDIIPTDTYAKLANDLWTCTSHALPHVAKLIWNNHRLRKHVCGLGNKALRLLHTPNSYLAFHERRAKAYLKTALDRGCRDEVCHEYGMKRGGGRVRLDPFYFISQRTWGQYCFKVGLMLQIRLVDGSRFTSVEKDSKTDRGINIEPLLSMMSQQAIMHSLYGCLAKAGNDLWTRQDVHRGLIEKPDVATIDLQNASNSNALASIDLLFPAKVRKDLLATRSRYVRRKYDHDVQWSEIHMYAPMGNATTFPVMTMILLAAARVYDSQASVFGDDIICSNSAAYQLIPLLEFLGYEVNSDKSFVYSLLKESCGVYTFGGMRIQSYDLTICREIADAIVAANKLLLLGQTYPNMRSQLLGAWQGLRDVLRVYVGPQPSLPLGLDMWVFDPSYQSQSSKEPIAAVDWLRRQVHLPSVDIILGLSPSELVNVEPTDVNLAEMVRLHDVCAEPILFKGSDNRKVTRLVVDTEGRLLCTVEQARAMRYRASRLDNRTQVYFYTQYWQKLRQYDVINHKRTLLSNN